MAKPPRPPPSAEITPRALYLRRREFLKSTAFFAATTTIVGGGLLALTGALRGKKASSDDPREPSEGALRSVAPPRTEGGALYQLGDPRTPFEDITTYNNYYELGTDKSDPAENAGSLRTSPWTIAIDGEVERPQRIDLDVLLKWFPLEERVYRMRCVETWSMVIPWLGFPLADLVKRLGPTSRAKYVVFETLYDPKQFPGQKSRILDWPYVEALRMDEAMNPLTLLAAGLYGKALLGQNGAPLRLVVPWKYGFKGIKSIVKIRFKAERPITTWAAAAPGEYGFFANVNPAVDHPRWSQATERRIGELGRRKTLPFNGYAEDVAHLYAGLDLKENF